MASGTMRSTAWLVLIRDVREFVEDVDKGIVPNKPHFGDCGKDQECSLGCVSHHWWKYRVAKVRHVVREMTKLAEREEEDGNGQ